MKVLIVDDERDIVELVRMSVDAILQAEVLEACSGNAAIRILKTTPDISLVISDYRMPDGNGGDLFKFMKAECCAIPFVLVSTDSVTDHDEFRTEKPAAAFQKPLFTKGLSAFLRDFNTRSATGAAGRAAEPGVAAAPDLPPPGPVRKYCRVSIQTVVRMRIAPVDIFLRLGEDHYVRTLVKGDSFEQQDYEKLKTKGIEFLFVAAADAAELAQNLERNIAAIASAVEAHPLESGLEIARTEIASSMELVREMSAAFGWDESLQRLVNANVDAAIRTMTAVPELSPFLSRLLNARRRGIADYSASVAFVSCGVVQTLGWVSDLTHYKLTLAAMLEDLTLSDEEIVRLDELERKALDSATRTEPQVRAFMDHPKNAAKALEKWKGAPPDVDSIIQQHQERPDGKGYPFGINHTRISPLAAVQIVSRDLVGFYREKGDAADFSEFLESRAELYSHGVFKKILQALTVMVAKKP